MLNESLSINHVGSAVNDSHIVSMVLLEQKDVMRYDSDTMCHM